MEKSPTIGILLSDSLTGDTIQLRIDTDSLFLRQTDNPILLLTMHGCRYAEESYRQIHREIGTEVDFFTRETDSGFVVTFYGNSFGEEEVFCKVFTQVSVARTESDYHSLLDLCRHDLSFYEKNYRDILEQYLFEYQELHKHLEKQIYLAHQKGVFFENKGEELKSVAQLSRLETYREILKVSQSLKKEAGIRSKTPVVGATDNIAPSN